MSFVLTCRVAGLNRYEKQKTKRELIVCFAASTSNDVVKQRTDALFLRLCFCAMRGRRQLDEWTEFSRSLAADGGRGETASSS